MKKAVLLLGLGLVLGAAGCYAGVGTMGHTPGLLWADTSYPLVAGAGSIGDKVGTAEATSYLGLVSLGDASVKAAADNGKITKIAAVDCKVYNVLGVYAKYTTIVRGD